MDEALETVLSYVYGDAVDPREVLDIVSKANDASEVHVNRPLTDDQKRERSKKRIALATNTVGVLAGPAAIAATLRDPRYKKSTTKKEKLAARGIPSKTLGKIKGLKGLSRNRKVMLAGAAGATALQVGNLTGDAISTQYFMREEKKAKAKEIVKKRREGLITTDEAIDEIEKFLKAKAPRLTKMQQQVIYNQAAKEAGAKGRKAVAIGAGLAGVGTGIYLGTADIKNINPSIRKIPRTAKAKVTGKKEVQKNLLWEGTISKVDEEKRQVFGWCSLTKVNGEDVVDKQGDYIPLDEVEKSAYNYVISSRKGGDMHKRDGEVPLHTSDMIESFVVTPEKLEKLGLEPDAMPHGWWVGFKVNDESQWEAVKKGERAHFSIHGKGKRVEKSMS